MNWISVKDRLPSNGRYLTVNKGGWINISHFDLSYEDHLGKNVSKYWHDSEWIPEDITHWQLLPELPKE